METELEQRQVQPRVAAVIGPKAVGKDALAYYLRQEHGVPTIEVGKFARELARAAAKGESHLKYDTGAKDLADYGSEHIISRLLAELVESKERWTSTLVITGVRTPAEAATLKAHFGSDLLLIYVRVGDQKTRFHRAKRRDFSSDPDDFQEFARQDEDLNVNYGLTETADVADVTLWNDGSLESFHQKIEAHVVPHLFPKTDFGAL